MTDNCGNQFFSVCLWKLISIKKNVKNILIPSEEDSIEMYPMDFEEFLWAMGDDLLMPFIRKQFEAKQPMGEFHRRAMDYFRKYMIIGGMPQAVNTYIETKDFTKADAVKRQILKLYRNDIHKYADNVENKVTAIYSKDVRTEDGIVYIPLYMTPLL